MPDTPQKDRWPEVTIYANGNVADRAVFDDVELASEQNGEQG